MNISGFLMELKPVKFQVALFLSAFDTSSKIKIVELVQHNSDGLINVDPFIVPSTKNTPDEIPIIIMQNQDSGWSFQISKERIDFIFESKNENELNFEDLFSTFKNITIKQWNSFSKEFFAKANRIGLIGTFVNIIDNPTTFLIQKYIKNEEIEGSFETQLHYLKKECIENINVNIWTRIIAVSKLQNIPPRLVNEIDVNTQPEFEFIITNDSINTFFQISYNLFKEKMKI